jgi:hypothetical protein
MMGRPKNQSKPESLSAKTAMRRVHAIETPLPGRPEEEPEWPGNLSDLTDEDLSNHLTYWSAMLSYVVFEVAREDVERKSFERQAHMEMTKAFMRCTAPTVTERKMQAELVPTYQELRQKYDIHDGMYRLLAALSQGYEQKYAAVSRELTRRLNQRERGY